MSDYQLNRREFLKLAVLAGLSSLVNPKWQTQQGRPNILVVVFDAWSAKNISLYGYPRQTMPYLEKLASRAVVYHNHYAGAPWTIPGTASLLTGTYPWTHRAYTAAENKTLPEFEEQNIFSQFKQAGYLTAAYSHNIFADQFFYQFAKSIDMHVLRNKLFFEQSYPYRYMFPKDPDAAGFAEKRVYGDDEYHSSLFMDQVLKALTARMEERQAAKYAELFPNGFPGSMVPDMSFLLEDGIDNLVKNCANYTTPYLSYYHFYPPHLPYHTRAEFLHVFEDDGMEFPEKPVAVINEGEKKWKMDRDRYRYDEYLLYVDAEFHRLYTELDSLGSLENTWLVLTSDHGEMFERGNIGHEVPTGADPAIHIPLLIFPPGQKEQVDVFEYTSAVDVLPTLLNITGLPSASWTEGLPLPPFSSALPFAGRSIFCCHPHHNLSRRPLTQGTSTIIKDGIKLIDILGHPDLREDDPRFELYDLNTDPEELNNLADSHPDMVDALLAELTATISNADSRFSS